MFFFRINILTFDIKVSTFKIIITYYITKIINRVKHYYL
jgi:hypothetical protein